MNILKSLRSSIAVLAVALSVCMSIPVGRGMAQQVPSLPGQFVYVMDGTKLYLVRGKIDEPVLLVQGESGATLAHPRFSSDGRFLAYCVDLASTNQPALYTLDTVRGERTQITPDGSCDYDWSPEIGRAHV